MTPYYSSHDDEHAAEHAAERQAPAPGSMTAISSRLDAPPPGGTRSFVALRLPRVQTDIRRISRACTVREQAARLTHSVTC